MKNIVLITKHLFSCYKVDLVSPNSVNSEKRLNRTSTPTMPLKHTNFRPSTAALNVTSSDSDEADNEDSQFLSKYDYKLYLFHINILLCFITAKKKPKVYKTLTSISVNQTLSHENTIDSGNGSVFGDLKDHEIEEILNDSELVDPPNDGLAIISLNIVHYLQFVCLHRSQKFIA